MKKTLAILSILILVLTLISCSNTKITENNNLEEQTNEKEIVIKEDTENENDLIQDKETETELSEENIESLDTENELEEVFEDDFDIDDLDAEFEEMDSLLEGW